MDQLILSLDIGTTHCKAALIDQSGFLQAIASSLNTVHQDLKGYSFFDPNELWQSVTTNIQAILQEVSPHDIFSVGITSMAETGLLIDLSLGQPITPLIPWFDTSSSPLVDFLKQSGDSYERFQQSGIRPNFKCSLAKILWLQNEIQIDLRQACWLGAADYIAYRLTGNRATDFSLAGRTYAFSIDQKVWDEDWLHAVNVPVDLFPPAYPSGVPIGTISQEVSTQTGLRGGTPVAIGGHDHVCAAFAAGAIEPGMVFDSMGTAEALLGGFPERKLNDADYQSGLVFGCHVVKGSNYWMGGLSASGGSVEWLRNLLGEPMLSYQELMDVASQAAADPTGILYFPYLAGSGSPHTDIHVRAAFTGLDASHGRGDIAKAVLEGTAYEVEFIRQKAEKSQAIPIQKIIVSGGGTRNPLWLQIKADVTGCQLRVLSMPEASLLGAAFIAGIGTGYYSDLSAVLKLTQSISERIFYPDFNLHQEYQNWYQNGYLKLQASLRALPSTA
jgi:sugar (pentulose or hexulose) kinase